MGRCKEKDMNHVPAKLRKVINDYCDSQAAKKNNNNNLVLMSNVCVDISSLWDKKGETELNFIKDFLAIVMNKKRYITKGQHRKTIVDNVPEALQHINNTLNEIRHMETSAVPLAPANCNPNFMDSIEQARLRLRIKNRTLVRGPTNWAINLFESEQFKKAVQGGNTTKMTPFNIFEAPTKYPDHTTITPNNTSVTSETISVPKPHVKEIVKVETKKLFDIFDQIDQVKATEKHQNEYFNNTDIVKTQLGKVEVYND